MLFFLMGRWCAGGVLCGGPRCALHPLYDIVCQLVVHLSFH